MHHGSRKPFGVIPLSGELRLITAVGQIWATDITYISLHRDFVNLVRAGIYFPDSFST
jgi:hypothetical protein